MTTSMTAAESWAEHAPLPRTECSVTRELYGYSRTVLDVVQARKDIEEAGFTGDDALIAFLILQDRAEEE